jgi:hypothetical protein
VFGHLGRLSAAPPGSISIFKVTAPPLKETTSSPLIVFTDTIAVYCENHSKFKMQIVFNVKASGMYGNHSTKIQQ